NLHGLLDLEVVRELGARLEHLPGPLLPRAFHARFQHLVKLLAVLGWHAAQELDGLLHRLDVVEGMVVQAAPLLVEAGVPREQGLGDAAVLVDEVLEQSPGCRELGSEVERVGVIEELRDQLGYHGVEEGGVTLLAGRRVTGVEAAAAVALVVGAGAGTGVAVFPLALVRPLLPLADTEAVVVGLAAGRLLVEGVVLGVGWVVTLVLVQGGQERAARLHAA